MNETTTTLESFRTEMKARFAAVAANNGLEVRGVREERDGSYPAAVWNALREDRAIGAAIPQEFGGLGLGLTGLAVVLEELAAADIGDMLPVLSNMAAIPIAQHGSDSLKRAFLPALADGSKRLAFAVTEREAGSNVFAADMRAVSEGDDFHLSGRKDYVSCVDLADAILILARTTSRERCAEKGLDPSAGLSMFLVDRDSPGLSWQRMTLPRMRSVTQYSLELDEVRVPADRLVAPKGFGMLPLLDALNIERILIPALVLGATRWLLDASVAHAKERRVFGEVPIGTYQAVQHPLAETFLRMQGLRLLLKEATETYDSGANAFEVTLPTAAARFAAVEVAEAALSAGGDAFGSRGFEPDIGILGFAQMVRVLKSTPISSPVMLNFVAEHHLGLPRSS